MTMTHQRRLENPLYKNWIRGALGLGYVHDGLYGFVNEKSQKQQKEILDIVLPKNLKDCTQCTLNNLLPEHATIGNTCIQKTKSKCLCISKFGRRRCPNGICSRIYDLIVDQHAYRDPLWKNTNPALWCTDHWSIARCFLTSTNYSSSAEDTDTSGLLSVITNNIFIQQGLCASATVSTDPFSKAREVRNDILHRPTLELQDTEMHEYIDTFIAVLSGQKSLHNDEAAKEAIKNLTLLKNCQIFISLKDELKLRRDAMNAVEEKKCEALSEIESAQDEALRLMKSNIDVEKETELENKKQIKKTQEELAYMLTRLKKFHTSQIIGQKKQRQTDDRLKKCEERNTELLEKIELNQESLQNQIDKIEHRQTSQEQVYSQLAAQVKELHQKIDDIVSPSGKKIVNEQREQYTITLEKQIQLQTTLISLYEQYYLKTDISPLLPEEDIDVDKIYVPLIMEKLYKHDQKSFRKGEPVYFYDDVFFQAEGTANRNVFITADAGIGKTTFCRKLTSTWCTVHSKNRKMNIFYPDTNKSKFRTKENVESRDMYTVSKFTYLFYVSLRHTDKERTIEDMICSQLLDESSKDLLISILKEHSDRCLVLLDGLDEWEAPYKLPKSPFITSGLPEKEVKNSYVTLYTTRPWKLEKIRPKTGEVDVEVKLIGMDSSDARKLAKAVIEKLNEKSTRAITDVDNFIQRLESNHFQNLESIPILLKLLTCLWHEEFDIGSSLCGLYSSVLEQLLRIAIERNAHDEQFVVTMGKLQTNKENKEQKHFIPNIFQNNFNCQALIQYLKVLSKIAFHALVGAVEKEKKANLVFESFFLATFGISEEEMQFCLKTGILSQRLLHGRSAINRCKSVTFIHKTFQEFFAALYVVISDDNKAFDALLNVCQNVEMVLEMGKVIQFIGGMSPQLLSKISEHIVKLTDVDTRFTSYRAVDSSRTLILMIQDLMFLSVKESLECGQAPLPMFYLRDVHLWDEQINKYVLNFDPLSIESLSTNSHITGAELTHITETSSLKLLCFSGLFGNFPKTEFFSILNKSSATLVCLAIKTGNIERSDRFNLLKLQNLRKIMLSDVTADHTTITRLLTDSDHLLECHAFCVYSFSDESCNCSQNSDFENPSMSLKSTNMQRFESKFGCGMLSHIGKADRLEELRVSSPKDPGIVNDIIRITQSCMSMKVLHLHAIGSELSAIPFPTNSNSLISVKLSEFSARIDTILELLNAGQNTDESCSFELENITLTTGQIDKLKEEIEKAGIFHIKKFEKLFKVKGGFRRQKINNTFESGSVFSISLVKSSTNK